MAKWLVPLIILLMLFWCGWFVVAERMAFVMSR
jgi:hypothetical protein